MICPFQANVICEKQQKKCFTSDLDLILARTRHELEQSAKSFFNRVILILRPFQLVFGGLFVLLGFLIFLSLLLTSVDKALHSLGPRSGYFLPNASLPNPVDAVLVLAQRAFPLDYIVYSGMVLFFLLRSDLCV